MITVTPSLQLAPQAPGPSNLQAIVDHRAVLLAMLRTVKQLPDTPTRASAIRRVETDLMFLTAAEQRVLT